jgi:hypothetical protein
MHDRTLGRARFSPDSFKRSPPPSRCWSVAGLARARGRRFPVQVLERALDNRGFCAVAREAGISLQAMKRAVKRGSHPGEREAVYCKQ